MSTTPKPWPWWKPGVWKTGKRFWTPERIVLIFVMLFTPLSLMWFIVGICCMVWAVAMWNRAWRSPSYGYRANGTMKTKFSELWVGRAEQP